MKTTNLKFMAYALAALMFMQSCTVYQKNLSSIDEALINEKSKKLVAKDDYIYTVKRIQKKNNNVVLTAPSNSNFVKRMASYVTEIDTQNDHVKLEIPFEDIKGFYLKDIKKSRTATYVLIFIPVFFIGVAFIDFSKNCCGPAG